MTYLWNWYAGLNDHDKFEISKIILEKGLLAIIIGIAGGMFAILMERYKSALKKEVELSKVVVPQIIKVLEEAEALYDHGAKTLTMLDQQAKIFVEWAIVLLHTPAHINKPPPDHYQGRDDLKSPIVQHDGETISITELLERTASDDLVKSVLHHPDFALQRQKHLDMDFPYVLYEALKTPAQDRNSLFHLRLISALIESEFIPLVRAPREEYHAKVDKFLLAIMRQLPAENRVQRHAFKQINHTIPIMRNIIDRFPSADLLKLEGIGGSYRLLGHAHATLVALVRRILNAV
jgi:hypothetical protein